MDFYWMLAKQDKVVKRFRLIPPQKPITTKERNGQGDYKLTDWNEGGLLRESWVRLAKITSLSKDDILRSLGQLKEYDQKEIIVLWQRLYKLQLNPPSKKTP